MKKLEIAFLICLGVFVFLGLPWFFHEEYDDIREVRREAEEGVAEAQYDLAVMYEEGEGTTQDIKKAFEWYKRAAEQGLPQAQYVLGVMYKEGKGAPQRDNLALKWYRAAAEQGYAPAQANLGLMYARAQGVALDYVEGYAWLRLAAAQGDERGINESENLLRKMTNEHVEYSQERIKELNKKIY